jgi:ubiquinone/menaquinone biosynthesis C-methylase UbiE
LNLIDKTIQSHYDGYYGSTELAEWRRLGAVDKVQNIIELARQLQVGSVLDIGCGDGAIIARLADLKFADVYQGVDISSSAIAAARARALGPSVTYDCFDGSALPYDSGQFHLAVLSHVVEHLEHPRVLLKEARRVADYLVIEVPCEHTVRLPRDYHHDPVGHINFYTPVTIRRLVQTCGLTVERQIVRNCSLAVTRHHRPWAGILQYAIREAALVLAPRFAPGLFVYHTALLCR